jgi:hypothetical protein
MRTRSALLAAVAALFCAALPARAQFWEKKDYTQWNESECKKMLEDSPWSKRFTITDLRNEPVGESTYGTGRESNVRVEFVAQLRSALPVRQAVIRLAQIKSKYDKMTLEQKQQFDERAEEFLSRAFDDRIIIRVEMRSNVQIYERQLVRMWSGIRPDAVPVGVFLIGPNKERVGPVRFVPPSGGATAMEFTFPRYTSEGALLEEGAKGFLLEMPGLSVGEADESRILFDFRADKMKFKGDLVY